MHFNNLFRVDNRVTFSYSMLIAHCKRAENLSLKSTACIWIVEKIDRFPSYFGHSLSLSCNFLCVNHHLVMMTRRILNLNLGLKKKIKIKRTEEWNGQTHTHHKHPSKHPKHDDNRIESIRRSPLIVVAFYKTCIHDKYYM